MTAERGGVSRRNFLIGAVAAASPLLDRAASSG